MSEDGAVLRVGLTGNIGAGKSTVGAMLAARGCLVLDADRLGHELLLAGSPVRDAIVAEFGDDIVGEGGNLDRSALAQVVFSDPEARRRLESLTHPAIRDLEDERVREGGCDIAVTEASLLVETGAHVRYHRLVAVVAPEAVRRARLLERGMSAADIARRMAAQMPQEQKAAAADYVIDNGGPLAATEARVQRLHRALSADLEVVRRGDELRSIPPR